MVPVLPCRCGLRAAFAALAVLALLLFANAARAAPAALVTDVAGDARAGDEPLRLLAELAAGSEIALTAGASAVVFTLADGSEWTLTGPGRFRLGANGPEAQAGATAPQRRAVPPAYRDIRLRSDRLQQGGLVLRGRERIVLVAPVNEVVVSPDVRFAWEPLDPGVRYRFELVDAQGRQLLAEETTATALALPARVRLAPGQRYYWALRASDRAGSTLAQRTAEFRYADDATRRRVDGARPKADAPFSERVLFVALLEDVGARSAADEARRALAAERGAAWSPPR